MPEVGISEKIAKYMIEQLVLTGKLDHHTANLMKLGKRIPSSNTN
jgi:CII-binding regulator of phage lambda lysogenization HflD